MNKAILMGRLTKDPEMRTTANQIPVTSFTVAVDRRFKSANGEKQADFIPVVAWRQQAEFVSRYFRKGSRIAVVGSIQTRSWDDAEGKRRWSTEVVADELSFVDSKRSEEQKNDGPESENQSAAGNDNKSSDEGFFPGPDDDTSLPFDL